MSNPGLAPNAVLNAPQAGKVPRDYLLPKRVRLNLSIAEPPAMPTVDQIQAEICLKHGITMIDLLSDRLDRKVSRARQEGYWRCRHETGHSLPAIAYLFRRKDHTTVMHGIKAHARRREKE